MGFRDYILSEAEQVSQWKDYVRTDSELQSAVKILEKISDKGYRAYIVGGAVRDIVMGKKPKDIDIATNMPMEELAKLWKIYDIGKSKDFGIVVVKEGGYSFEIAQFRQDSYQKIKGVRKIIEK